MNACIHNDLALYSITFHPKSITPSGQKNFPLLCCYDPLLKYYLLLPLSHLLIRKCTASYLCQWREDTQCGSSPLRNSISSLPLAASGTAAEVSIWHQHSWLKLKGTGPDWDGAHFPHNSPYSAVHCTWSVDAAPMLWWLLSSARSGWTWWS